MNELFESLDINEDMKANLSEAFDKAVLTKSVEMMDEHVETKVEEAKTLLEAEYVEKVDALEDTLDGYMTSVVEEFVNEQKSSYEAEIVDEKAKKILEMFDSLLTVAGVTLTDIQEAKSERDIAEDENSLENQVARLDKRLSEKEADLHEARKESDKFLKAGFIAESKKGLTLVEGEKFEKLAEMVTFERSESYASHLDTIKESIIDGRSESFVESVESNNALPSKAFKPQEVDVAVAMDFSKYV